MAIRVTAGLSALAMLVACERAPGPHDHEVGAVTYWEGTEAGAWAFDRCSSDLEAELGDDDPFGSGGFVTYMVEEGGKTALDMDCSTTDADSCTANTDIQYVIDNHTLTAEDQQATEVATTCDMVADLTVEVEDFGETGTAFVEMALSLDGAGCTSVETQLQNASSNEYGADGCIVSADVELVFSHVD